MTFGQLVLPSLGISDDDLRKAFVRTSQQINQIAGATGQITPTGSQSSVNLPAAASAGGSTLTYLNTGSGKVTINGKASGYSSWSLDSGGNFWAFYSDGQNWWCIGGSSTGSNSNGSYVKFADGTMICVTPTGGIAVTCSNGFSNAFGSTSGTLYYGDGTWTFPVAFLSVPTISSGFGTIEGGFHGANRVSSATSAAVNYEVYTLTNGGVNYIILTAIGKWK